MVEIYQIWCDTCEGSGEIDETLGGEYFSNPHAKCPDCEGNGFWLKEFGKEKKEKENMEHVWKVGDEFVVLDREGQYHDFSAGEIVTLIDIDSYGNYLFENAVGFDQFMDIDQVSLIASAVTEYEIQQEDKHNEEWTDKHYDNKYQLSEEDIKNGFINLDVYFVSKQWKIGSRDESGALWHCLKTIARFGDKNSKEREIKALYAQIKCLAKLEGVDLD